MKGSEKTYRHQDVMRIYKGELKEPTFFSWVKKDVICPDETFTGGRENVREYSFKNLVEIGIQIELSKLGLPLTIMQSVMLLTARNKYGILTREINRQLKERLPGNKKIVEKLLQGAKIDTIITKFIDGIVSGLDEKEKNEFTKLASFAVDYPWLDKLGYQSCFVISFPPMSTDTTPPRQSEGFSFKLVKKEALYDFLSQISDNVKGLIIINVEKIYENVMLKLNE